MAVVGTKAMPCTRQTVTNHKMLETYINGQVAWGCQMLLLHCQSMVETPGSLWLMAIDRPTHLPLLMTCMLA